MEECSRPLWGIYISIQTCNFIECSEFASFSSPMGYLYFYSFWFDFHRLMVDSSRPLWGIYISILSQWNRYKNYISSRPLWGIYISIPGKVLNNISGMLFSSPMGYLYFYSPKQINALTVSIEKLFSSPMGYLYFYS